MPENAVPERSDQRAVSPWARPIKRKTFLKAMAGTVGAGMAAAAAGPAFADVLPGPADAGKLQPQALEVTKIADLSGPGITTRFRMEATDLGIPVRTPDGRTMYVFGDTFEAAHVGGGFWRSPVALYSSTTDLNSGVKWDSAFGGDTAQQLWFYEHDNPVFSTVLPSDVITIGNTMYLHVMVNKGLGNVVWTEIWRSDDSGATWVHTGAKFPGEHAGGRFQLLTWDHDGEYVYVYSTRFNRAEPIIMHRVPVAAIADPAAYEPWGFANGAWAWGNPPTPILSGRFGEMSLRRLDDGVWMLTWFNAGNYRIDGMVMDSPVADLYAAHKETLIWGGAWGREDDSHVAQLYGGYIIPGSTVDDIHLSVSQWNTEVGWPYRVMQHRIRGFGG